MRESTTACKFTQHLGKSRLLAPRVPSIMPATERFATDETGATWVQVAPSHDGLESRCRTAAGPSKLWLCATSFPPACVLGGLRRWKHERLQRLAHHPSDRAAPCAFYLAIARSAVWVSPFLRGASPNCDQTKFGPIALGAGFVARSLQSKCRILGGCTHITWRQIDRSQRVGAAIARSVFLQIERRKVTR